MLFMDPSLRTRVLDGL